MKIDQIPTLIFEDNGFRYRKIFRRYDEIRFIAFTATVTEHISNGSSTGESYEARLRIFFDDGSFINIFPKRGVFGGLKKEGMEGLQRANGVLSNLSFDTRIEKYEHEMKERGFFTRGSLQFHKSGDVFKNGKKRFNLADKNISLSLSVFAIEVEIKEKKKNINDYILSIFKNSNISIDISVDRDCILYLLKFYFNIAWKDTPIPEKKDDFYSRSNRRKEELHKHTSVSRRENLAILGLEDGASIDEIKRARRDLARQYHSDVLQSQGMPESKILEAHEKLVKINKAYDDLMGENVS